MCLRAKIVLYVPNPTTTPSLYLQVATISSQKTNPAPKGDISSLLLVWPVTQNPQRVVFGRFSTLPCRPMRRRPI
jgi:hypothetical protein